MGLKILGTAAFLSLTVMSLIVHAQDQDYNSGVKQELSQEADQLYPKRAKRPAKTYAQAQLVTEDAVQGASSNTNRNTQVQIQQQAQPIYILQQPTAVPQAAQTQPTTTVEAAAARESRSEALRKTREDVERQTEDKLGERLENDRLQSEKDRADRLFNIAPAAIPAPTPAPVVVAPTPAPVVVVAAPEVVSVTKAKTEDMPVKKEEDETKFSVGALAGIGSYPSVTNVNGAYALGVVSTLEFTERFGVEVAGVFSNYDLRNVDTSSRSYLVNVDQINITGGVNYRILEGRISPIVGALAGYARRNYSDRVSYGPPSATRGSNSFDGGFSAGVDLRATKRVTIGADIRYMMNLSYRTDDALAYNSYNPYSVVATSPLESASYYFMTLNLKLAL
jgi:outer membrane protein W